MSDTKRLVIFFVGLLFIVIAWLLPLPGPFHIDGKTITLTDSGKMCLGILAMLILYWITEVMPFCISGLLAVCLMHLFGVEDFEAILAKGFGHPITCFVLGILLLSLAVTKTGLGYRITHMLLSKVGKNPNSILLGFIFTGAIISMWMSDSAVAAFLMPIAVSIARDQNLQPLRSNFGKALLIACVWGPSVGGISTPAGAAPNPIVLSFLQEMAGVEITFLDWMAIGVPATVILIPISWLLLIWIFPPEMKELHLASGNEVTGEYFERRMTQKEWYTVVIFLLTVLLWMFTPLVKDATGVALRMEYVIIFTTLLFFLPGIDVLRWDDVHKDLNWGAVLLVMSGVAIGFTVHSSGATEWISFSVLAALGKLPLLLLLIGTVLSVALLHNLLSSNTVTAIVLVPIIIYLAIGMNMPVWLSVAPAAFASTFGLIMVTSTPTNLIPYTAGYFSIKDFAKAGIFMTCIGAIAMGTVILFDACDIWYQLICGYLLGERQERIYRVGQDCILSGTGYKPVLRCCVVSYFLPLALALFGRFLA